MMSTFYMPMSFIKLLNRTNAIVWIPHRTH